jgi:outer membrane immunogenic protein
MLQASYSNLSEHWYEFARGLGANTASKAGLDMKRVIILAAATIAVVGAAPAFAADLPARAPATYSKAPAIVEAAYDWSGFYVGINGGGGTSKFDWNFDGVGDEGSHNATGGTVGGQFGYRWQMSSVVFGLEAQGNWADFTGSNSSLQFSNTTNATKVDAFGLFTGQIGYAWDRALFYVNGGAAVTDNKYTSITTGPLGGIDNTSETRWGAAVGVGFEYAFAPNWSLGFQYDHLFMGNKDVVSAAGFIADHISENVDIFTARVNYKFGGPMVARY